MANEMLKFLPFSSSVGVSFWHSLVDLKLDVYKLNEDPIPIHGYYRLGEPPLPSCLYLERDAFSLEFKAPSRYYSAPGTLYNTNTVEAFKNLPKANLFKTAAGKIWHDIITGEALRDPSLLNRFLLLTFADLKKYRFYYMFGFPALRFGEDVEVTATTPAPILDFLNVAELSSLMEQLVAPTNIFKMMLSGYFLIKKDAGGVRVGKLSDWASFWEKDEVPTVGFADPSTLNSPGWPLRNLLMLLAVQFKAKDVNIVCYRGRTEGVWFKVTIPDAPSECPAAVGWEKNQKNEIAPRFISLESTMDPKSLADTSVDLNLKLMRWRILPSLNLEAISQTKCLLLGAGTLGCNVARVLLSWGVRNITLVDNGVVSYSNPVRQSLFEFADCAEGGKPKALAAAAKLKLIFPNVEAQGIQLSIPMPGHAVNDAELPHVTEAVKKLEELVKSHDAIFLLTDSRESRWLPTLLGVANDKLVMNSALGFDTYLVMRHGAQSQRGEKKKENEKLGCYFCNDVVAPQDSQKDRTLDQQCTVTRPGLAYMAAALSVELFVTLLHHPLRHHAPHDAPKELSDPGSTPLGTVPHQLRGFLTHFTALPLFGNAYPRCTACSDIVVAEYQNRGLEFLLDAFNNPHYLEKITGLTQMADDDVEWVEEGDDF